MATTTNNPPARCLDLTRLISRVGRGPLTGIDRVEREYLTALLIHETPLFGLVRIAPGFALLDQSGMSAIADRLNGNSEWGPHDALSHLRRKSPDQQRRAKADIRRLSIARGRRKTFGKTLIRRLAAGTEYLNVGHSNLTPDTFAAVQTIPKARITVMIHDTIPLDFPQFQRAGTPRKFEDKLRLTGQHADTIISITNSAANDIQRHLTKWGAVQDILVAPLGVNICQPELGALPDYLDLATPYFVVLGTIEPRKNHSLLLNIWENMAKTDAPSNLFIVGQRGWNNRHVFDRLDAHPAHVTELNNLSDAAVSALLTNACALLFPSHAEGFGLPAAEAMALGTPVICNNLPVFHEVMGNYPVYADTTDMYSWEQAIKKRVAGHNNPRKLGRKSKAEGFPFSWGNHFNIVLKRT
jgi:glycosyltransferase involved in cell wall biosynthesis